MKIIIDIPKDAYKVLQSDEGVDWLGAEHILHAISNGTPLPLKHGRLIDADKEIHKLNEMKVQGETFTTAVNFAKILMREAPTVIEADKIESETKMEV